MDSKEVYARVQRLARLDSVEEARATVQNTLASIVPLLDHREQQQLADQLPDDIVTRLGRLRGLPDDLIDREVFIGRLVNLIDTEYGYDMALGGLDLSSTYADNEAERRARAVFSVLPDLLDASTAELVKSRLPGDIRDWWPR